MRRDPRAYLNDVIEAGDTIRQAVDGISLEDYGQSRLIRSSVKREFTIIGEALTQLPQRDRGLFAQIGEAPRIIAFRNKLTQEQVTVNHQLVWEVIEIDLPRHLERCNQLISQVRGGES